MLPLPIILCLYQNAYEANNVININLHLDIFIVHLHRI